MTKCCRPNLKNCPYREENYNNVENVITACHAQPCTFYLEQVLEQKFSYEGKKVHYIKSGSHSSRECHIKVTVREKKSPEQLDDDFEWY